MQAFLIIEKGAPYDKGTSIPLKEKILIGRAASSVTPDISFDSFLISRKHCSIEYRDGEWNLSDLGSKHGTTINDQMIDPVCSYHLKDGDRIGLAGHIAAIRFMKSKETEKTIEQINTHPLGESRVLQSLHRPIFVDMEKMSLLVHGRQIPLSAKEWQLIALLYQNCNKVVDCEKIRSVVWAERNLDDSNIPDVSAEEINILIYRLRKKMGAYGHVLITLRGRGYILEL